MHGDMRGSASVCVRVGDRWRERESEFRGAKRKRCLACWMPIRSWRPICSMSFPLHSWISFFQSDKTCSQKVAAPALLSPTDIKIIVSSLPDSHSECAKSLKPMQIYFFCWTVIVTTHATTISDALMVVFSPNVLLLHCLNKWVNATSLRDTLSAWMSYWNVHLNNKWPFNSLVSLDLSKDSTVNYSKQGAAAIECHGA